MKNMYLSCFVSFHFSLLNLPSLPSLHPPSIFSVTCCQFAPNGWLLAIGDNSGVFLLFDAFSGKAVSQKQVAHDGGVRSIALQPPEKSTSSEAPKESVYLFATGGEDFSAKVWKVQCSQARGRLD